MSNSYTITDEFRQKLISILKFLIHICEHHNIRYYSIAGTLIGAVRHKGFIPWDDDIDIVMPRADYNRFIEAFRTVENNQIGIHMPKANNKYYLPYVRLYDKNTSLISRPNIKYDTGLFLDVFPLDNISDKKDIQINQFLTYKRYRDYLFTSSSDISYLFNKDSFQSRSKISLFKELVILTFRRVFRSYVLKSMNQFIDSVNHIEGDYFANYGGLWLEKEIWKKEWFDEQVDLEFEGLIIKAP